MLAQRGDHAFFLRSTDYVGCLPVMVHKVSCKLSYFHVPVVGLLVLTLFSVPSWSERAIQVFEEFLFHHISVYQVIVPGTFHYYS